MTKLALMRHGHTAWNRAGQIQGRTDIALDAAARDELAALKLPADWQNANVVSSPLKRAVETAQLVAGEPTREAALTEMNWGAWEGKKGAELAADPASGYRHIEEWSWQFCPPEGESLIEVWQRVEPWLASLTEDSIAICHIGIMRIILARAYEFDFIGEPPFAIKRNRLFVLEVNAGVPRMADPAVIRLEKKAS